MADTARPQTPSTGTTIAGSYNATAAAPGSMASVSITNITYADARPQAVDPQMLAAAEARLAALPTDVLPAHTQTLPAGSRMRDAPNPNFVGHQQDLLSIARAFKAGGTPIIATGLGGIGKTQLAIQFVHLYGHYFAGGVFWLSFEKREEIAGQVASCGGPGGMEIRPDFHLLTPVDQVRLVLAAWQNPLPRLLVFDSCEDPAMLARWRPPSGGSRVLVTSQRGSWRLMPGARTVPLGTLYPQESVALLRKHRPDLPDDDQCLAAIADEVGNLPLALHLAGSLLALYRHAMTPQDYLARLRSPALLDELVLPPDEADEATSPTRHVQDVARTFALSFDRLQPADERDSQALRLLARAACFLPGSFIPRTLLTGMLGAPKDDGQEEEPVACHRAGEDALRRLLSLGLVEEGEQGDPRLHRLLAHFARERITGTDDVLAVEESALLVTQRLIPVWEPAHMQAWTAHLRYITDRALGRHDERSADLARELGGLLHLTRDLASAEHYYEQALEIQRVALGDLHPDVARSLDNLGQVMLDCGNLAGARRCFERALGIRRTALGDQFPDVTCDEERV